MHAKYDENNEKKDLEEEIYEINGEEIDENV